MSIISSWTNTKPKSLLGQLTDGGEDIGETEVVHCVEWQQVVEKLLFLIIAAQESISLV